MVDNDHMVTKQLPCTRHLGERLSHAVGCAFAACLERKQKRDKECGVTMTFDHNNSTFTRMGSFKQTTMTERMQESQEIKLQSNAIAGSQGPATSAVVENSSSQVMTSSKGMHNPYAIERPHATPMMLQRQGSFRGFNQLQQTSPFKRQLSLRLSDLPSNLERQQRSLSLESSEFSKPSSPASPQLPPLNPRTRLHSLPNAVPVNMSPIPESSPVADRQPDSISAMCQQLAQGLTMMSNNDDPFTQPFGPTPVSAPPTLSSVPHEPVAPQVSRQPRESTGNDAAISPWNGPGSGQSRAEAWLASTVKSIDSTTMPSSSFGAASVAKSEPNPVDIFSSQVNARVSVSSAGTTVTPPPPVLAPPRRAPHIAHLRSQSLGAPESSYRHQHHPHGPKSAIFEVPSQSNNAVSWSFVNGSGGGGGGPGDPASTVSQPSSTTSTTTVSASFRDPFDAEWAALAARTQPNSTNPFTQNTIKAFEVHM